MKKLFWIMLLIGVFAVSEKSVAQVRNVPANASLTLQARYPGARDVDWKNNKNNYQAIFYMNGYRYDARFNKKGEWRRTIIDIPEYRLPSTVTNGLRRTKYSHWRVRSAYAIYSFGQRTRYRVRVSRFGWGLQEKNLVFDLRGKLLRDNSNLSM